MSSTEWKNAGTPKGTFRNLVRMEWKLPPEDDDSIAQAQNTSGLVGGAQMLLNGAGIKNLVTNSRALLPYPMSPTFTFSQATDAGTMVVYGTNQFGDQVNVLLTKTGSGTVLKTLSTASLSRIPCFQTIDRIECNFTAATGTVKVGSAYASGTSNNIPLPCKLAAIASIKGIWVDDMDGQWGSASAINGAKTGAFIVTTSSFDTDAMNGVIAIQTGITGAHAATGATYTDATKTLTKTGFFASYTPRAGDTVVVTGGTAIVTGTYHVAHKVDSDSIVLVEDIGTDAADVAFNMTGAALRYSRGFILLEPVHMQD